MAWQQVRRHIAADLAAAGFDDVQDAHLSVFHYPGPDRLRPSDLGRQLRISRQATNHLIKQLEALGYLERRSPADGDRRRVHLTRRGQRLVVAIERSVRRLERQVARRVGRARFATFLDVLTAICDLPPDV
jgi:DNA-binding MarR family transcriptional regulator